MRPFEASPGDVFPVITDWSTWLNGASIASASFAVEGDLTKGAESTSGSETTVSVTLSSNSIRGKISCVKTTVTTDEAPPRIKTHCREVKTKAC
jgi:hypothetical protein